MPVKRAGRLGLNKRAAPFNRLDNFDYADKNRRAAARLSSYYYIV
jgi:hypothetical protein